MAGSNNLSGDESILFADNLSFNGAQRSGKLDTDGQLWIGSSTSDRPNNGGHVRKGVIRSPNATIDIGYDDPDITIDLSGGGVGIDSVAVQNGISPVTPDVNGQISVFGSHGLNTTGTLNTVTVAIDNAITLGDLSAIASASNALSATTGDINIAAGNFKLPATNAGLTQGVISQSGSSLRMHTFGNSNIFLGNGAGNGTLAGAENNIGIGLNALSGLTSGDSNVSLGDNCLRNVTSANNNCAIGTASLTTLTTSAANTCIGHNSGNLIATGNGRNASLGYQSINQLATGADNVCVGFQAGTNYTGAESSNIIIGASVSGTLGESNVIRIGTQGSGSGQQLQAHIAGVINTVSGRVVKTTVPGAYPYTTLTTDYVILVDTTTPAKTINLIASPVTGTTYRIKDSTGTASSFNITIVPAAGTIDGAANTIINVNYGSVDLVYSGSEWKIL